METLSREKLQARADLLGEDLDAPLEVVVFEQLVSTSDWALQQNRQGRPLPFACFAEQQTQGRGRRGKQWLQSAYANIAMSLSWSFTMQTAELTRLPLAIAVSIINTLKQLGIENAQIKWPNDILVDDKKLAGILIDVAAANVQGDAVVAVIGIGLNYDMSSLCDAEVLRDVSLTDTVTLQKALNKNRVSSRNEVAAILLSNCVDVCRHFPSNGMSLLQDFERYYDYCRGKQVDVMVEGGQTISGIATGVTDNAELIVSVKGKQHIFQSAEVSVRAK